MAKRKKKKSSLYNAMITIIIFVLILSVLVFVHELGHFVSARRLGVGVEEFGFGFPPRIIGIRRGKTIYSINWLPLGGFVRLKGESPETQKEADSFSTQSTGRRFVILAAGVAMNYLLSIVLFTIGFSVGLPTAIDSGSPRDNIKDIRAEVVTVDAGSPASKGGVRSGDTIQRVNTTPIGTIEQFKEVLTTNEGQQLSIIVKRGSAEQRLAVTPAKSSEGDYRIGVGIIDVGTLSYPFPQSMAKGITTTVNATGQIFSSFGNLLRNLVIERKVSADLSGPVGVVVLTGQAFRLGIPYLLQFVALLSITLAVVNFFPLPALDGGRALFVIIEAVRRKPVDQRIESLIHAIGFYTLIAFVLLISLHDVQKFDVGEKIIRNFQALFNR